MTTPRVTVPVEPEYTATDYLRLIAEGWEVIESTGSQMTIQNPEDDGPQDLVIDVDAMLSAAPAPEGGAVSETELRDAIALILPMAKGYAAAHPVGSNQSYVDYVENLITTREEAPAEEGEPCEHQPGCDCTVAEEDVARSKPPLHAQPQAREEAQPVMDREALITLIMEETTDDIVADGWDRLGKPNVLVQGCRFIRRNAPPSPEGYANPEASAKQFAGFIADRILKALAALQQEGHPDA